MNKGLDSIFLHYGVRKEDMALIEQFCLDSGIDAEWMKEFILRELHEERNNQNANEDKKNNDDKKIVKLLKRALKNLPS